jgi:hypothetical protein
MRSGRTYEVFVDDKPVKLVGSTLLSLKERRKNGYIKRFGPTVELRLIREIPRHENEDDVAYNFHLKASEALDIARKKTYIKDGGLNKISPLIQAIGGTMLETERGKIGGLSQPREAKVRGGRTQGYIQGPKNVESGQIRALGRKNVETGRLRKICTFEVQSKGGKIGGRIAVKTGQLKRVCTSEVCSKGGRIQGRKNVESGQAQKLGSKYGPKNAENGQIQPLAHIRWHVKRGVLNPDCSFCTKESHRNARHS